jgi:hypothetical protein
MRVLEQLPLRPSTLRVLLLPVAVLCAPVRAQASCGDYVHITGSDNAQSSWMMVDRAVSDHTGMPPPAPCPCSGPQCSRGPVPQPLPGTPVPPISSQSQLEAILTADASADPCGASRCYFDQIFLPLKHPSSIFHPPRAS